MHLISIKFREDQMLHGFIENIIQLNLQIELTYILGFKWKNHRPRSNNGKCILET